MSRDAGSRPLAVIDIGTVTTRLMIAQVRQPNSDAPDVEVLEKRSTITQLGEGLSADNCLKDEAIQRVVDTVASYMESIRSYDAVLCLCVATSAARDAANHDEFENRLTQVGVKVDIISGEQEAAITFRGITSAFPGEGILTCDIGGGSTELVLGDAVDGCVTIHASHSFDIGARRMTELYLPDDPPTPEQLHRLRADVTKAFREEFFDKLNRCPQRLIAVAGSATSAVAIALRLEPYDSSQVHGAFITKEQLDAILAMLAEMDFERRCQVPGLEPRRAGIIIAGLTILAAVMDAAGLNTYTASESDLLIGAVLESLDRLPNI